ncbi:MAG: IPT/TIG domain-containing protein [Acidimicrobiales bacterium]
MLTYSDRSFTPVVGVSSVRTSAEHFSSDVVPAVTALNPAAGSTAGGISVVVTGSGFDGASAVEFGSVAATGFTVDSATQITATSPAESTGTVDLTVITPGGTSVTSSADSFSYGATITGVVTDANNRSGVSSVCVYATASDGSSGHALTGTDGTYAITGLSADSYSVKFDGTCGETDTSNDVIQWYNDASSQSAATPSQSSVVRSPPASMRRSWPRA